MRGLESIWTALLILLILGLLSCVRAKLEPPESRIWFHNEHEEYFSRNGHIYDPRGREVFDGEPMRCWITGKPIGYEDLSLKGRRVAAN